MSTFENDTEGITLKFAHVLINGEDEFALREQFSNFSKLGAILSADGIGYNYLPSPNSHGIFTGRQ